jgi:hypothetical protein
LAAAGSLAWAAGGIGLPRVHARDAIAEALESRRRRAIRRGCAFLAKKQNKGGSFGPEEKAIVALTSLAVLALMADGSTDGRGPYGEQVKRGLNFLLKCVEERPPTVKWHEGYFYQANDISSQMHGQGYATLALATALGTSTGKRYVEIRNVLEKAVACIEQSQTQTGGFGSQPVPTGDHEGSVTVTVAQGLRAAHDAGLRVNHNVVRKGLHYLKRSQKADGSFKYSIHSDRSSYALTAAALSSFFLYGRYMDDAERTIHRGLEFMMDSLSVVQRTKEWYYYGHLYAAWTCWQKDGDEWDPRSRGYWARWHRTVYPDLLRGQRESDGAWNADYDRFEFGDVLYTSFAVLTLAIPDEVLPIFQR